MKRMHHFRTTHGKHQQALMSVYKKPPEERQQQIEDYRLDDRILRVYTDASELGKKGIFGLAMACVGDGDVIMRSTKYYNQQIRGKIFLLIHAGISETKSVEPF